MQIFDEFRDTMKTLVEDENHVAFVYEQWVPLGSRSLETKATNGYSFDLTVYEVCSWDIETYAPLGVEKYLTAHIRWDGISHFFFGDEDGYIHGLDPESHCSVIKKIFELAKEHLGDRWEGGS